MTPIRRRLTYANVMSSIAVFLVLAGGSAFAAAKLGKNTVGTKQLKNNAVTTAKIKNGAVTSAKINLASLGTVPSATNASHANSADTANSANTATNANHAASADTAAKADLATRADSATDATNLPAVLAPGQTLRGDVSDAIDVEPNGISSTNVSFAIPLAAEPTVHIIEPGKTVPSGCSGSVKAPAASSGNLCIFIGEADPGVGTFSTIDPENVNASQPAAGKFGFFIYNNATAQVRDQWWGSWAVTG